jgi:GR25 family glycosyltransferase involved in LPS biosynthesis
MDVHVINLERTKERYAEFVAKNPHLGSVDRVPAVDGCTITVAQLIEKGIFSQDAPGYSNGAIGCALSHLSLWQKALQAGCAVTVAEDDAIFNQGFDAEAQAALQGLPDDWDIVLWGWNFDSILLFDFLEGVSPCLGMFSEPQLRSNMAQFGQMQIKPTLYRLKRAFGTLAYTISSRGAQKLAQHCLPIRKLEVFCPGLNRAVPNFGIDVMMNSLYADIDAYVSFPPLAASSNDKTTSTVNRQ